VKRIRRFRAGEVEVKPFAAQHFFERDEASEPMAALRKMLRSRSSRRAIRQMAERAGLEYDRERVDFARKLIRLIADEIDDGK